MMHFVWRWLADLCYRRWPMRTWHKSSWAEPRLRHQCQVHDDWLICVTGGDQWGRDTRAAGWSQDSDISVRFMMIGWSVLQAVTNEDVTQEQLGKAKTQTSVSGSWWLADLCYRRWPMRTWHKSSWAEPRLRHRCQVHDDWLMCVTGGDQWGRDTRATGRSQDSHVNVRLMSVVKMLVNSKRFSSNH